MRSSLFAAATCLLVSMTISAVAVPPPLPEPRAVAQAVLIQGRVFVFGGVKKMGGARLRGVYVFDPNIGNWTNREGHEGDPVVHAAVTAGDRVFALVAQSSSGAVGDADALAEYGSETGEWTILGQLSQPRMDAALVAFDGRLYVIGGFKRPKDNIRGVEAFDLVTRKWSAHGELLCGRHAAKAVVFDRQLYVLGGVGDTFLAAVPPVSEVERFDPAKDEWTIVPGLKCPSANFTALQQGEVVYIVGGFARSGAPLPVSRLDLVRHELQPVGLLCRPRADAAVVRVGNELWVIGGAGFRAPAIADVEVFPLKQ